MARSDHRAGFALPAVLTVTGVVTLIFLVAITALSSLNNEARSARERLLFLESALSAEATLQLLAATEPLNTQGLNPGGPRLIGFGEDGEISVAPPAAATALVHLDGRPYEIDTAGLVPHPIIATLRDQAGMINLARLDDIQLTRLGDLLGMPTSLSRSLHPLLVDYTDEDDLETINGAERARYGGTEGPSNRFLIRTSEFLSILGIRRTVSGAKWREVRADLATDHQYSAVNVNTASSLMLQVAFGLNPREAEAAIRARERAPFLSLSDFIAASGANIVDDSEQIFTFPASRIVYTINDTRSAWRYRARLVMTPFAQERPFWVDQTEMTEAPRTAMASADATRFPYTPH